MISCTFPYNPVLIDMSYKGLELTLAYKKKKGKEVRTYHPVPIDIAYGLLYKKNAKDLLAYYADKVKGHFAFVIIK